jgi:DNA-binding NarL/FixJ family response regulator
MASPEQERPIDLIIIHLRAVAREAVALLFAQQRGVRVVAAVPSAHDLVEHPPAEEEPIVVYDFDTARQDGPELMADFRATLPGARIMMFNVPDSDEAIIECARTGVSACILEDVSVEGLLIAVRSLAHGTPPVSPRVITSLFNHIASRQGDARRKSAGLTRREEEILELVAEGYTNKEIAARLFLQHQTVKNHVRSIFNKLEVHSRFEVVRSRWGGGGRSTPQG